jgi:hypothetical protein
MPLHFDIWGAFVDGAICRAGLSDVTMRCHEAGAIVLPSGRIVACDPFTGISTRSYRRTVEPGAFPVFLAIADYGHDRRVAAAMILFQEGTVPVSWEDARVQGEAGHAEGFIVDSGRACFRDVQIARRLAREAERGKLDRWHRMIRAGLDENHEPTWSWAGISLVSEGGHDMVAFTTGLGDGSYCAHFGLDRDGEAVCLAADCGVLGQEETTLLP